MTMVVTADDLRPWRRGRKFALLHDRKFIPLGGWNEVETANDPVVKELLATSSSKQSHRKSLGNDD